MRVFLFDPSCLRTHKVDASSHPQVMYSLSVFCSVVVGLVVLLCVEPPHSWDHSQQERKEMVGGRFDVQAS